MTTPYPVEIVDENRSVEIRERHGATWTLRSNFDFWLIEYRSDSADGTRGAGVGNIGEVDSKQEAINYVLDEIGLLEETGIEPIRVDRTD